MRDETKVTMEGTFNLLAQLLAKFPALRSGKIVKEHILFGFTLQGLYDDLLALELITEDFAGKAGYHLLRVGIIHRGHGGRGANADELVLSFSTRATNPLT